MGGKRNAGKMFKSSKNSKKKLTASGENNAQKLFHELVAEEDPTVISMEGIFQLGEKLGIDATEDIRILVLVWKMGCNGKPSEISQKEWMDGCAALAIDSWDKLHKLVPSLDTGFLDQEEFKDFYKFCFQFNRQGTHRTLDKDLVVGLLKLALKDRIPSQRVTTFCEFLETSDGYSRITLDQWTSFLDFCYECDDLNHYDETTSAWPVMIDEYVDFMANKTKTETN